MRSVPWLGRHDERRLYRGGPFDANPKGSRKLWHGKQDAYARVLMLGFRIARGEQ